MQDQLMITERLACVGDLAAGIAHEVNNPLTSVVGFSQLLLERDIPDEIRGDIQVIYREGQRAAEVIRNLITFARRHAPAKQLVNINSIIEKVLALRAYEQKSKPCPHHVVGELVKDGCNGIAVAEHFHVISDSMSKYHCRQHVLDGLQQTGANVPVVFADQIGGHSELDRGVVLKVKDELAAIEPSTNVAIFLSNHGFPVTKIGKYDATTDCYHENARKAFDSVRYAILETVEWSGRLEVLQVFGQFLDEKYNPGGINTRPLDTLKRVVADGFRQVIDIPYEFPGDTVDVLVKLRQAYGIDPPRWAENFETRIERDGISVKICSALFHPECRINAYFDRACEAVDRCLSLASA